MRIALFERRYFELMKNLFMNINLTVILASNDSCKNGEEYYEDHFLKKLSHKL